MHCFLNLTWVREKRHESRRNSNYVRKRLATKLRRRAKLEGLNEAETNERLAAEGVDMRKVEWWQQMKDDPEAMKYFSDARELGIKALHSDPMRRAHRFIEKTAGLD